MCPWLPVSSAGLAKEGESIYSMIAFLALLLFGVQVNKVLQIFIFQTTPSFMVVWGEF